MEGTGSFLPKEVISSKIASMSATGIISFPPVCTTILLSTVYINFSVQQCMKAGTSATLLGRHAFRNGPD